MAALVQVNHRVGTGAEGRVETGAGVRLAGPARPRPQAGIGCPAAAVPVRGAPAPPRPLSAPPPIRPVPEVAAGRETGEWPAAGGGTVRKPSSPVARPEVSRLVAMALMALVVAGTLAWIGLRSAAGTPAIGSEPPVVATVGAGETVWDVARRVRPDADPVVVVEDIRELNQLVGSAVQPGQRLRVPGER